MEDALLVKFIKTGNLYQVVDYNSTMKHPVTRKWEPAVIYKAYKILQSDGTFRDIDESEDGSGITKTFVRLKSEFVQKFEPVLDL
jgi:hypothetical protein